MLRKMRKSSLTWFIGHMLLERMLVMLVVQYKKLKINQSLKVHTGERSIMPVSLWKSAILHEKPRKNVWIRSIPSAGLQNQLRWNPKKNILVFLMVMQDLLPIQSVFVEFALSILMLKLNFPLPCCSKLYFISFIYFSFFYNHSPFPMSIKLLLWLPPWERVVQHCRSYCFVSGKCGTPCSIVFQCQGPRAWLGRSIPGQIPW